MNHYRYANAERTSVTVTGDNNGTVPKGHRFWRDWGVRDAEEAGKIGRYYEPGQAPEDATTRERKWRDEELKKADIELFIAQDGQGTKSVKEIREWRVTLRDYPEHPEFPNGPRPPYPTEEPKEEQTEG